MTDNHGWTAQSQQHFVVSEGIPGQTFTEDQLPHPDIQRLAGIDPEQYRRQFGLWIEPSDKERPEFIGTETGRTPTEVKEATAHVESFRSTPSE